MMSPGKRALCVSPRLIIRGEPESQTPQTVLASLVASVVRPRYRSPLPPSAPAWPSSFPSADTAPLWAPAAGSPKASGRADIAAGYALFHPCTAPVGRRVDENSNRD